MELKDCTNSELIAELIRRNEAKQEEDNFLEKQKFYTSARKMISILSDYFEGSESWYETRKNVIGSLIV